MKFLTRLFALSAASLLALTSLHAQSSFEAGFYAGATMQNVNGTNNNSSGGGNFGRLGVTVAGTVSAKLSHSTRLQMELRFFQRGAQISPVIDTTANNTYLGSYNVGYNEYFTMILDYVDVVIGVKHAIHFNLRNKATDRYGIEGGVSLGTLVGYSYEVSGINYNLDLSLLDVSPYVGIYYNVTPHFYIEARFSNSVNSVLKHDVTNESDFYYLYYGSWDRGHTEGFSLTLGFNFGGSLNHPADKDKDSQ